MLRYLVLASIIAYSNAGGYQSYGYSNGYGGGGGGGGYSSGVYSNGGGGGGGYGAIPAAIKSIRTVDVRQVNLPQDPIYPQILEIAPLELPIQIVYNSKSSPVLVHQNHIPGAKGQVERTSSEEEPHKVMHEVLRPVIQEIREVITPYRRVVQEIQPVIETVNTIVARGERAQGGARIDAPVSGPISTTVGGGGGYGSSLGGSGGGYGSSGGSYGGSSGKYASRR